MALTGQGSSKWAISRCSTPRLTGRTRCAKPPDCSCCKGIPTDETRRFRRPSGHAWLRQHRPGRAAADPAPYRHAARPDHHPVGRHRAVRTSPPSMACAFTILPLTRGNYRDVLTPLVGRGDFLLNLSVDVSSVALIALCPGARCALSGHLHRALGRRLHRSVADPVAAVELRAARKRAGAGRRRGPDGGADAWRQPRAGVAFRQGSAAEHRARYGRARRMCRPTRAGWAALSRDLGVKVIHIAERDTQTRVVSPSSRASSSTPGRSTGLWARAASRPNSAGGRMRRRCRRMGGGTISAAMRRSI